MSAADYVEYVYLSYLQSAEFDAAAGDRWIDEAEMKHLFSQAMTNALLQYGYGSQERYEGIVDEHWSRLRQDGILVAEGDEFVGYYLKFVVGQKDRYIQSVLSQSPVAQRIRLLGSEVLQRAIDNVATAESWGEKSPAEPMLDRKVEPMFAVEANGVPASDRVVSLSHNQQAQIEASVDEVVGGLQEENSVDGDSALRQRFLGELRAGRELIRAQSVRAYLLYETLFRLLGTLIERYKGQALGEAAKKLLDLLIEHVFGK